MVAMTTIPSDFIFNILYKKVGFPAQRLSFTATDMISLLKMLRRTESISVDTTEMLIVHQVLPDGRVLEVMSHDLSASPPTTKTSNVTPIRTIPKETPRDEEVINTVHKVLVKAKQESKELVPLKNRISVGWKLTAYAARSGNEYQT